MNQLHLSPSSGIDLVAQVKIYPSQENTGLILQGTKWLPKASCYL